MTAFMYRKARQSHYFIFLMPKKNCNKEFHFFGFTGQLSREEPDGFYSPVTMTNTFLEPRRLAVKNIKSESGKAFIYKICNAFHIFFL